MSACVCVSLCNSSLTQFFLSFSFGSFAWFCTTQQPTCQPFNVASTPLFKRLFTLLHNSYWQNIEREGGERGIEREIEWGEREGEREGEEAEKNLSYRIMNKGKREKSWEDLTLLRRQQFFPLRWMGDFFRGRFHQTFFVKQKGCQCAAFGKTNCHSISAMIKTPKFKLKFSHFCQICLIFSNTVLRKKLTILFSRKFLTTICW